MTTLEDGDLYQRVEDSTKAEWKHINKLISKGWKFINKGAYKDFAVKVLVLDTNIPLYCLSEPVQRRYKARKKHNSDFANSPAMKFAEAYEEHETEIREGYENNG